MHTPACTLQALQHAADLNPQLLACGALGRPQASVLTVGNGLSLAFPWGSSTLQGFLCRGRGFAKLCFIVRAIPPSLGKEAGLYHASSARKGASQPYLGASAAASPKAGSSAQTQDARVNVREPRAVLQERGKRRQPAAARSRSEQARLVRQGPSLAPPLPGTAAAAPAAGAGGGCVGRGPGPVPGTERGMGAKGRKGQREEAAGEGGKTEEGGKAGEATEGREGEGEGGGWRGKGGAKRRRGAGKGGGEHEAGAGGRRAGRGQPPRR